MREDFLQKKDSEINSEVHFYQLFLRFIYTLQSFY